MFCEDPVEESNEIVHENVAFIQSLVSIWKTSTLEASDYLANYGLTLCPRELFCLLTMLLENNNAILDYEASLDWLSKYDKLVKIVQKFRFQIFLIFS